MSISFEDTKTAFNYKTNKELKRARFLFELMRKDWLVKWGVWLIPIALKIGLPIKGLVRKTIFNQFVGGETLEETSVVAEKLSEFNVKVILDYAVERKEGEENFDKVADGFINVIQYAATQPTIPFMSVKLTGIARFELLQKISNASDYHHIIQGEIPLEILNADEKKEWGRVVARLYKIGKAAAKSNIGVLVDAEESWIQDPVDAVTTQMMQEFNIQKAVFYNTAQLYRKDRLQFVKDSVEYAKKNNYIPAIKLVRGAYMEKERERAYELNYPIPINENKQGTDEEYNAALEFCINPENNIHIIIGSHNEYSNLYAIQLMKRLDRPLNDPSIFFSQLYGMSDNITFNLAKAGCLVSKYLPFGAIKDVIPYLMRRAEENSSLGGQTGRELSLIKKELKRRYIYS